jgi:hypothetical protein
MPTWDELMVLMSNARFQSARGVVRTVEPPEPEDNQVGYEVVHHVVVRSPQWKVTSEDGDLVGLHDGNRILLWEKRGLAPIVRSPREEPYVLHEPLDVFRPQDLDDWRPGEDYAAAAEAPQRAELLRRTCWRVDLLPPSHKSGLWSLWIDDATGIRLRSEHSEAGLLHEVLELEVDGPVGDDEFTFTGPVDQPELLADDVVTADGRDFGRWFHVSSSLNRESILAHGLDSSRMGAVPGIAGSLAPEQPGCFVSPHDAMFFVRMNNTGGPVDVWEVLEVNPELLADDPDAGFQYLPGGAEPEQVRLVAADLPGGWPV